MTIRKTRLSRLFILTALLAVAPACNSSAGGVRGDGRGLRGRFADRIAYRPVYPEPNPVPRTRALYPSGYAGAQYGPRRAAVPVQPTTYEYVPSPWAAWLHQREAR